MKSEISQFWLTAARSEFAKPAEWRSWADKLISSMATPPIWIIQMSLAMDFRELKKALADTIENLREETSYAEDDALIGFIWLRFERHEIDLPECLRLIGEAADSGCSRIS